MSKTRAFFEILLLFSFLFAYSLLQLKEKQVAKNFKKPSLKRTPRGYDDVGLTAKELSILLPEWIAKTGIRFQDRPDLILSAWPEIIGEKLAHMTTAVSFIEGMLTVKVKNSSLYSLLVQHERARLQKLLQKRFPSVTIRSIIFRLG